MPHLLVAQLRFARSELVRCLDGISVEDAVRRLSPMNDIGAMNCISWIVGHLAYQESAYWVEVAQGQQIAPGLRDLVGLGQACEHAAAGRDVGHLAGGHRGRRPLPGDPHRRKS